MKSTFNKFYVIAASMALVACSTAYAQEEKRESLKEAIARHGHAVQLQIRDAKLFYMDGLITIDGENPGFNSISANFSISGNDVRYFSTHIWGSDPIEVTSHGYRVVQCGGAYRPGCGKETGEAEPSSQHPAIRGLKIDVAEIVAALQAAGMKSRSQLPFSLTTPGRANAKGFLGKWALELSGNSATALRALPPHRGVVVVREPIDGMKFNYLILDGLTGKVITRGIGRNLPHPAGAVSSGN